MCAGDSSSVNIQLMCNVGATYIALGKYKDAEEIQTKALSVAEKVTHGFRSLHCTHP